MKSIPQLEAVYLGDSVYAEFDGYNVVLYLRNGGAKKNFIVLEPSVCDALNSYLGRAKAVGG